MSDNIRSLDCEAAFRSWFFSHVVSADFAVDKNNVYIDYNTFFAWQAWKAGWELRASYIPLNNGHIT